MGIRKIPRIASFWGALCIITLIPLQTCGQELPSCAGHGAFLVTVRNGQAYFSSWDSVPHFFTVKSAGGKAKQLINLPNHSVFHFFFGFLLRGSEKPEIVPAPCGGTWNGENFVFEDPASRTVWVFTFSASGRYLSAEPIGGGNSPQWTPGGNLTYRTRDKKLSTHPVFAYSK